jgi:putative addiction module component (TIGR02574 family)
VAQLLDEIEKQAMALPEKDRAALAERLLASLDEGEDEGVEEAWAVEAERRDRELQEGKVKGRPASEVLARVRRALR